MNLSAKVIEMIHITDDVECVRILTDANKLHWAKIIDPQFDTCSFGFEHDGVCWFCLFRKGFENPADNGYELFGIPSGTMPVEEIARLFTMIFQADTVPGTPIGCEMVEDNGSVSCN